MSRYLDPKTDVVFKSEVNEQTPIVAPELLAIPEINQAVGLAEEAGYSEEELVLYEKYWDAVSTERTLMKGSFDQGKEKKLFSWKYLLPNLVRCHNIIKSLFKIPIPSK